MNVKDARGMRIRRLFLKWSNVIRNERQRLAVFSALFLVGALSFEAGFLAGGAISSAPLTIEKPTVAVVLPQDSGKVEGVSVAASAQRSEPKAFPADNVKDCVFVGSRNSTLYHLPTCAPAKRIKPENIVCFSSVEDAVAKGYKPGCLK